MINIVENTSVYIEFSIWGEDYDPDDITKTLGILPTYTCQIGTVQRCGGMIAKMPTWELRTEECETIDIELQIQEMINLLKPFQKNINFLKRCHPDYTYKFCPVISVGENGMPGLSLSVEQLSFLVQIESELEFDILL